MAAATLTSKWQMVLPKPIREYLRLHPGDKVDFMIRPGGEVIVRPGAVPLQQLKGILHKPGQAPLTVAQMKQAIRQRAGRRA